VEFLGYPGTAALAGMEWIEVWSEWAAKGGLEVSVHDLERCLLIAVTLIFFSIGPLAGRQRPVSTTSDTGCSRRVPAVTRK
jgi:hypothetical protein